MKNTMITSIYYGNPPPFERKPPIPVAETPRGRVKTVREALLATLTSEQGGSAGGLRYRYGHMGRGGGEGSLCRGLSLGRTVGCGVLWGRIGDGLISACKTAPASLCSAPLPTKRSRTLPKPVHRRGRTKGPLRAGDCPKGSTKGTGRTGSPCAPPPASAGSGGIATLLFCLVGKSFCPFYHLLFILFVITKMGCFGSLVPFFCIFDMIIHENIQIGKGKFLP